MCCRRRTQLEPQQAPVVPHSEHYHHGPPPPPPPEYAQSPYKPQPRQQYAPEYPPPPTYSPKAVYSRPAEVPVSMLPTQLARAQQLDTAAARLSNFLALKSQGSWLGHDAHAMEKNLLQRLGAVEAVQQRQAQVLAAPPAPVYATQSHWHPQQTVPMAEGWDRQQQQPWKPSGYWKAV